MKNKLLINILGGVLVFLGLSLISIGYMAEKSIININDLLYSNIKKDSISEKMKVNTSIDLVNVFAVKTNYSSLSDAGDYVKKAIIKNGKIYYGFMLTFCEDELKEEICKSFKKEDCISKSSKEKKECEYIQNMCFPEKQDNNLCKEFYKKDKNTEGRLYGGYVFKSNLDGSNREKLLTATDMGVFSFDYEDDDMILFNSYLNETSYQIDLKNSKASTLKDNTLVVPYKINNKKEVVLFDNDEFSFYDVNTLEKTRKPIEIFIKNNYDSLSNTSHEYEFKMDEYNKKQYYYMVYDNKTYEDDNVIRYDNNSDKYILKNKNKKEYKFNKDYSIFFPTKNYVYIFQNEDEKITKYIKVNKNNLKEVKKGELSYYYDCSKYLATGSDGLEYLYCNNEVYTFNEKNEELKKINISMENIYFSETYNNYILLYGLSKEDDAEETLVLYNTKNKELKVLRNVVFYDIDDNKLYTVEDTRIKENVNSYKNVNMYYYYIK